jgi:hypothetical protein
MFWASAGHASGTFVYNWVWIVIGLVTILGFILAGMRYVGMRAVRNEKLDQLLHEVKPDGGKSLSLGDTVARTESKLDNHVAAFQLQLGHTNAVESEVYRRLNTLETRAQVEARLQEGS